MRTPLPTAINTADEARAFLSALHTNRELFHPDDNANTIVWMFAPTPTPEECDLLNTLMFHCATVPGFDVYEYCCTLL